ncbi:hypothetical protein BDZ89DRAFT_1139747 [Hymenopellis radicata]|nr:hypothetical protein BDZ89DRAFT_1139747 [Hymenopellis radicata]
MDDQLLQDFAAHQPLREPSKPRQRGRPRLYHTAEERAEAKRERDSKWYNRPDNHRARTKAMRKRYHAKAAEAPKKDKRSKKKTPEEMQIAEREAALGAAKDRNAWLATEQEEKERQSVYIYVYVYASAICIASLTNHDNRLQKDVLRHVRRARMLNAELQVFTSFHIKKYVRRYSRNILAEYGDQEAMGGAYAAVDTVIAEWDTRRQDVIECLQDVQALVGQGPDCEQIHVFVTSFNSFLTYLNDLYEHIHRLADSIGSCELLCQQGR